MTEPYNPFAEFQGPEWEATDPYDKFLRFNQVFYSLPEFANQRVGVREKFRNKVLGFKDTGEMLKGVMGSVQGRGADQRTSAEAFNEIARHWRQYEEMPVGEKQKFRQMLPGVTMDAPPNPGWWGDFKAGVSRGEEISGGPTEDFIETPARELQSLPPGQEATREGAVEAITQDYHAQQRQARQDKLRAEHENRRQKAESEFMASHVPGQIGAYGRAVKSLIQVPIIGDITSRVLENVAALPGETLEAAANVSELGGNVKQDFETVGNFWEAAKGDPISAQQLLARPEVADTFAGDNIFNEVADSMNRLGYDWIEEVRLSVPDTEGAVRSVGEVDGFTDGLRFIAGASGDMVGFMGKIVAGQAVGGPVGGFLMTAIPTTSEVSHEIYRITGGEMHPDLALPAGLANAAMEKVGFDMIGRQFTQQFRSHIRRGITARLVGSMQTGGVESLTEATQQLVNIFVNREVMSPEEREQFPEGFWEQVQNLSPDEFAQLVDSAASGLAGGIVMGGAGNAYSSYLKDMPPDRLAAVSEAAESFDEETKDHLERLAQTTAKTERIAAEVEDNPEFQEDINQRDTQLLVEKYGLSEQDAVHVMLRYAQAVEGEQVAEVEPEAVEDQGLLLGGETGTPLEETVAPVTPEAAPETQTSEPVTARTLNAGDLVAMDDGSTAAVASVEVGERGQRTITFDNGEVEIVSPNSRYTRMNVSPEAPEQQLQPDQTQPVTAKDLSEGDQIVVGDGEIRTVTGIEQGGRAQRVITFDNGETETVSPRVRYTKWAPPAQEQAEGPTGPALEPETEEEFKPGQKRAFKAPPTHETPKKEAPEGIDPDEAISRLAGYELQDAADAAAILRTGGDLSIDQRAALDAAIQQSRAGEIDENLAPALDKMLRGKLEAAPAVKQKAATTLVLGAVEDGAETMGDLATALPDVSKSELRKALAVLREQGKIGRSGEGRTGSPFRFAVPGKERAEGEPDLQKKERTPPMKRKAKRYKTLLDAANTMEELDAVAELWAQEKSRPWWVDFEDQIKKKRAIISKIGKPRKKRAPTPQKADRTREEAARARRQKTTPKPKQGTPPSPEGPFGRIAMGITDDRREIQGRNVQRMTLTEQERQKLRDAGTNEETIRLMDKIAAKREVNPTTGLPNKAVFKREFTPNAKEEVIFLDVDNLKAANEIGGYPRGGDALLTTIADGILDQVPRDRVYHITGDEFAIVAPKGKGAGIVRRMRSSLPKSITFQDKKIKVGFAHGIGNTFEEAEQGEVTEKEARRAAGISTVRRTGKETPEKGKKKRKKKTPKPKRSLTEIERATLREVKDGEETTGNIARKTGLPRDLIRKAFHSLGDRGAVRLDKRMEGEREKLFATPTVKGEEADAQREYRENKAKAKEARKAEKEAGKETPLERVKREYEENPTPIKSEREARDRRAEKGSLQLAPEQQFENDEAAARARDEWARNDTRDFLARGRKGLSRGLIGAYNQMKATLGTGQKTSQADFKLIDKILDRITRNREQRARDGKVIQAYLAGEEGVTAEEMNKILKGRLSEADLEALKERRDENTERHEYIVNSDIIPEAVRQRLMKKEFYLRRAYERFVKKTGLFGRQRRHEPKPEDKQDAIELVASAYGKEVKKLANRLYGVQGELPGDFDFVEFFSGYETAMLRDLDPDLADRMIGLRNQIQHFMDAIDVIEDGTEARVGIVERTDGIIDMAAETVDALINDPGVIRQHGGMIQIGNLQERFLTEVFRRLYGEITDPAVLQALTTESQTALIAQAQFFDTVLQQGEGHIWSNSKSGKNGHTVQLGKFGKEGKLAEDDVFRYGKLAGKFVAPEFKDFLDRKGLVDTGLADMLDIATLDPTKIGGILGKGYAKLQGFTRTMALTTPGAFMRNYTSSYLQFAMNAGDFFHAGFQKRFAKYTIRSIKVLFNNNKAMREIAEDMAKGAFRYTQASIVADLAPVLSGISRAQAQSDTEVMQKALKTFFKMKSFPKKVKEAYILVDYAAKKASWETRRELAVERLNKNHPKMSEEQVVEVAEKYATEHVSKFYQNAEKVPEWINAVSRVGLADFTGFKYDSMRMAVNGAINVFVTTTDARNPSPEGSKLAEWKGVTNEFPELLDTWQGVAGFASARTAGVFLGLYGPGQYLFLFGGTGKLLSLGVAAISQLFPDVDDEEVDELSQEQSKAMNWFLPSYDANSVRWEWRAVNKDGEKVIRVVPLGSQFGNFAEESLLGIVQRMTLGGESPAEIAESMAGWDKLPEWFPMGMTMSNIYEAFTGYDPQTQTKQASLTDAMSAATTPEKKEALAKTLLNLMADSTGGLGRAWKKHSKKERRAGRTPAAGVFLKEYGWGNAEEGSVKDFLDDLTPLTRILRVNNYNKNDVLFNLGYKFDHDIQAISEWKSRRGIPDRMGNIYKEGATEEEIAKGLEAYDGYNNSLHRAAMRYRNIKPLLEYLDISDEEAVSNLLSSKKGLKHTASRVEIESIVYDRVEDYINSPDYYKPEPRSSSDTKGDGLMRSLMEQNPYMPPAYIKRQLKAEGYDVGTDEAFEGRWKEFRRKQIKRKRDGWKVID